MRLSALAAEKRRNNGSRRHISVDPNASNGSVKPWQVMIDKIQTMARDRLGEPIGRLEDSKMTEVNRLLVLFLGLG